MKYGVLLFGIFMIGCSSSHKLTGTDFVNLENEQAPAVPGEYPAEVVEDLGWDDIRSDLFDDKGREEFRFWVHSEVYPAHLFRFSKKGKEIEGEAVLYWPLEKEAAITGTLNFHDRMKLYIRGSCKEVIELQNFAYCIPDYVDDRYGEDIEPDWAQLYNRIESQNIWQLPDENTLERSGDPKGNFELFVQLRLGNFYRSYLHSNPETYREYNYRANVQSISGALSSVPGYFSRREWLNTYQGLTEGTLFTLCDSSETWQFWGNLKSLVSKQGFTIDIKKEEEEDVPLFYVVIKGQVEDLWHDRRIKQERDRRILVVEVGSVTPVTNGRCPEVTADLLSRN